jgi:large subunit ribosomal protein L10
MEVGLNLRGLIEDGVIFDKKVLDVDDELYKANIQTAYTETMNLAVKLGYATKDTIKTLLTKAARDASALADSQDIITKDNIGKILAKAEAQASALKK